MTRQQAMKKAKKLWGETGYVRECRQIRRDSSGKLVEAGEWEYRVGTVEFGMMFSVKGSGPDWKSAFEKAGKQ